MKTTRWRQSGTKFLLKPQKKNSLTSLVRCLQLFGFGRYVLYFVQCGHVTVRILGPNFRKILWRTYERVWLTKNLGWACDYQTNPTKILVFFKLAVLVHRCLNGRAPPYLSDYCVLVASAATRRHLCSASHQLLAVPRYCLNTYGRRAFSVAGPTVWNSPGFHPGPDHQRRVFQSFT